MKLLEYQSKNILREAGLPVPRSLPVKSAEEIPAALQKLGITRGVVKAQAFTGARGKAGGIKLFNNEQEAKDLTSRMIGMQLVTHQTGPEGVKIHLVLIEEACSIEKEFYMAITLDRTAVNPLIMISPDGGMDIEAVSAKSPERILRIYPEINQPISAELLHKASDFLGLEGSLASQFHDVLQKLYVVYYNTDAMLLEINPLAVTTDQRLLLLDCKLDIDDNADYRQMETGGDPNAEKTHSEIEAANWGMSYISMDGNIGCMVNGAGLAMATMDSIKYSGGSPANFLDVGGSATEEAVAKAIEIIAGDHAVECILVNIFGGIMKCDTIAIGIVAAVSKSVLKIPMVVRLEGNNVELGKEILANSGLNIQSADSLDEAARKAVLLTRKNS
ncbi:MAG TPA: ADP-forming succinate--CoA ligase subunit beta [Bacteroidales bacterium]|nr:ADP-forming succinate--CoA ligase subunit beta [Bacteroidales bacterium]